jgi:sec-independent protein translocase protein TatA
MRVGITELVIILAIVLLMFGSKKLPELADGMGKAIRNFKKGINSDDDDVTPRTPADKQVGSGSPDLGVDHRPQSVADRKS